MIKKNFDVSNNIKNEKSDKIVQKKAISSGCLNEEIPYSELRVISAEGDNLGEFSIQDALNLAKNENLDLVLISSAKNDNLAEERSLPVAKIMNYSKKIYEDKKKLKLSKKKNIETKLKEIRISIKISDHDLRYKMAQGVDFLIDGIRVKVGLFLKGRERGLKDTLGVVLMDKVTNLFVAGLKQDEVKRELAFEEGSDGGQGVYRVFYLKK